MVIISSDPSVQTNDTVESTEDSVEVVPNESASSALSFAIARENMNHSQKQSHGSRGSPSKSNALKKSSEKLSSICLKEQSTKNKARSKSTDNKIKNSGGAKKTVSPASSSCSIEKAPLSHSKNGYPPQSPAKREAKAAVTRPLSAKASLSSASIRKSSLKEELTPNDKTETISREEDPSSQTKDKKHQGGKFRLFRRSTSLVKKGKSAANEMTRSRTCQTHNKSPAIRDEMEATSNPTSIKKVSSSTVATKDTTSSPSTTKKMPLNAVATTQPPSLTANKHTPPRPESEKKTFSSHNLFKGTPQSLSVSSKASVDAPSSSFTAKASDSSKASADTPLSSVTANTIPSMSSSSSEATETILRDLGGDWESASGYSQRMGSRVSREAVAAAIDETEQEADIRKRANRYRRKAHRLLCSVVPEKDVVMNEKTVLVTTVETADSPDHSRRRAKKAFLYAAEARRLMDLIEEPKEETEEAVELIGDKSVAAGMVASENSLVVIGSVKRQSSTEDLKDSSEGSERITKNNVSIATPETVCSKRGGAKADRARKIFSAIGSNGRVLEDQLGAFYAAEAHRIIRAFSDGPDDDVSSADIYSPPIDDSDESLSFSVGASLKSVDSLNSLSTKLREEYATKLEEMQMFTPEDVANSMWQNWERVRTGIENMAVGLSSPTLTDLDDDATEADGSTTLYSGSTAGSGTLLSGRTTLNSGTTAGSKIFSFDASEATGVYSEEGTFLSGTTTGSYTDSSNASTYNTERTKEVSNDGFASWLPRFESKT